jgi:stage III sporulation protein AG
MMKKLRDFLRTRDKMALVYVVMFGLAGVLLIVLSNGLFGANEEAATDLDLPGITETQAVFASESQSAGELFHRERELEKRLEEAFAQISGVGQVRILLSLSPEKETVYAADTNTSQSVTHETDAQGGNRETQSQSRQDETIIITDSTGQDRPLVLREIDQKVEGAVIIAEGGDNVFVKDALTKAACTVLNVEANKVQVLEMSKKDN